MNSEILKKLTLAQQSIYFDQLLKPDSPVYNVGLLCRIFGEENVECLHECIAAILNSPSPLMSDCARILIEEVSARETPKTLFPLTIFDLSLEDFDAARLIVDEHIKKSMETVMEMNGPPLIKSFVFVMPELETWWFVQAHHILSDASGLVNFVHAVADKYNEANNESEKKDDLDTEKSYLNAANLNSEITENNLLKRQFWKDEFCQFPNPIFLHQRNKSGKSYTHAVSKKIPLRIRQELKTRGFECRHALRAALILYFSRIFDGDEIVLGSVVHGRNRHELHDALGMFSRILPTRVSRGENLTISQFLENTSKKIKSVYQHQADPIVLMAREAGVFQIRKNGLADVVFNYINLSRPIKFRKASCLLSFINNPCELGPVQLRLYDRGDESDWDVVLYCESEFFSAEETSALLDRLLHILGVFGQENSQTKYSNLDLLFPQERYQILEEWNSTQAHYPQDKCIHALFEEQVV
ncbi:condensation domain-containing protein, partial [Undibacterium pigrum]